MIEDEVSAMACPSCNREFELPHKSARPDDLEFLPIPRVLTCLHTVCQSCLEEMKGRSSVSKIVCPVCREDKEIKGVGYLPLDVTVLKTLLKVRDLSYLSSS